MQWVMVKNSEDDPSTGLTLPVCIERKTISDLVARSAKRDHLKQLRRLSNLDLTSFLLLGIFSVGWGDDATHPICRNCAVSELGLSPNTCA